MRRSLCGAAGLVAVGLLTIVPAFSNAQTEQHEKELLKVRMWNRWSDVMRLYGQPTRIEIGAVTSPTGGGSASAGGPSMGAPPMGGKMGGMSGGGMSMGKMGGMGGLPGMGGMMGSGGMSQGSMGGAMMGQDKGGGGGGSPFAGSMSGGGGGSAGFGGAASSEGDGNEGEITWVYEKSTVTNYFLFNKDGRVIQVQSFGRKGPAITAKKITLGDTLGKIFDRYGWTANIQKDVAGGTMMLDYSKDRNVLFQFEGKGDKNYKVVGITVGITDRAQIRDLGGPTLKSGSAGAGMSMGGPMGGKMGGGMSGGPMGGGAMSGKGRRGGGGANMGGDN